MKSTHAHALHYVKSKAIAIEYPTFALANDEEELTSIMAFVEKMHPDTAIIVCQRSPQPSVQYASATCGKILGMDVNTIMKMTLPDFLDHIHADDIDDVNRCYAQINSMEPYDPSLFRFEMTYRLRFPNGQYAGIRETKLTIKNSRGKFIYLNLFKDISPTEKVHSVRLNIYQYIHGDYRRLNTYHPRSESAILTQRENEIANLIGKGFSNEEIANLLHVSINTVKNHKNRLFKKANVKTSVELASLINQSH